MGQSNQQFYKKITKPYGVSGDMFCFCHVSEEGWERRGGKGKGGCGEIFLWSCLSEYHSLVTGNKLIFFLQKQKNEGFKKIIT